MPNLDYLLKLSPVLKPVILGLLSLHLVLIYSKLLSPKLVEILFALL
jgi:hypothetical protein